MDRDVSTEDPAGETEIEQPLRREQKLEMTDALAGFHRARPQQYLLPLRGNDAALLNLNQSLKPELKPVGLDQLLKGTERILRRVLPTAVPTKFSKHTLVPVIMADVTQPQQVIMNLAADDSRAMPVVSLLEVQARNGPKYVTIAKRSRASAIYRKMRSGSTYRSRRRIATRRRLAWAGIYRNRALARRLDRPCA